MADLPTISDDGQPIPDGLTLLRKLRESGTPDKVLDVAMPVVADDPHASSLAVVNCLRQWDEIGRFEGTLRKAEALMTVGKVELQLAAVHPLDALAIRRSAQTGEEVAVWDGPQRPEDVTADRFASLLAELEAEKAKRAELESILDSVTGPGGAKEVGEGESDADGE